MFRWIKKANRSKNYFLKRIKLKLKLNLLSMIAAQGRTSRTRHGSGTNHLIIPFIGKGIGDAIVIGGVIAGGYYYIKIYKPKHDGSFSDDEDLEYMDEGETVNEDSAEYAAADKSSGISDEDDGYYLDDDED